MVTSIKLILYFIIITINKIITNQQTKINRKYAKQNYHTFGFDATRHTSIINMIKQNQSLSLNMPHEELIPSSIEHNHTLIN